MLKDCLEVFKKEYRKYGDSMILDNYKLSDGTYILVKKNGDIDILNVKKDEIDGSQELYDYIAQRDYLSRYIDSNKALNTEVPLANSNGKSKIGRKVVYSNNYLSFFIKKETLHLNKINNDVIDKYYEVIESTYGVDNKEYFEKVKDWMLSNFMSLEYPESEGKEYLKIFFQENVDVYRSESDKYIKSKIYNSNKYNVDINGITYGLPNNNMGLNAKKPYLENRTRKNTVPYLISEDEVLMQKKFFDYLMGQLNQGRRFIYIDDKVRAYKSGERPEGDFTGYYLRISKGLEPEILDMDILVNANTKMPRFEIEKPIEIEYESKFYAELLDYTETEDIRDIERSVNEVFFGNFLKTSYFLDFKDIKLSDQKLKKILYDNRDALFSYFYKGNASALVKSFPKFTLDIIKNTLANNPIYNDRAIEQYNLRYSLSKYLNGGVKMSVNLNEIKSNLRAKINSSDNKCKVIKTDEEFYYAIGQLSKYFMTLSKSGRKNYSYINPILNASSNSRVIKELEKMFKRYNYTIYGNGRFDSLYSMILGYKPENKVNHEMIIAGYLNDNLMYEKK